MRLTPQPSRVAAGALSALLSASLLATVLVHGEGPFAGPVPPAGSAGPAGDPALRPVAATTSLGRLTVGTSVRAARVPVPAGTSVLAAASTPERSPALPAVARTSRTARVTGAARTAPGRRSGPRRAAPVATPSSAATGPSTRTRTTGTTASRTPAPTVTPSAPEALAARRSRLLASMGLGETPLGWTVVLTGPRTGYQGLSESGTRTITLYVRARSTDQQLRVTLAHELGHAYDAEHGTKENRAAYLEARGARGTAWYPCQGCSDFASGAGDLAEVFAVWLVGSTDFRSTVAGRPTRARAGELVRLLGA